jgi:hypothetical protein
MEMWKKALNQIYEKSSDVIASISVPNPDIFSPLVDGFDYLVLVITETSSDNRIINDHFSTNSNLRLQIRHLSQNEFESWILTGPDRRIIQWIMDGEILMDANHYLQNLRERLVAFPTVLREKKLLMEFNHFMSRYLQAKEYLHHGHLLDAYSNILIALHHWARLAIIETGVHPEVMVWNQVKQINPGIYKLYDELMEGDDSVQQRIQLVLLACEFSVMSKMEQSCGYLLNIMKQGINGWTVQELNDQQDLGELHLDISLLLKKLVKKGLVQEKVVPYTEEDGFFFYQIRYS